MSPGGTIASTLRRAVPGSVRTLEVHVDDLVQGEAVLTRSEVATRLGVDRTKLTRVLPDVSWTRVPGQRETVASADDLRTHLPAEALDSLVSSIGYLRPEHARQLVGPGAGSLPSVLVRSAIDGAVQRMIPPQALGSVQHAADAAARVQPGGRRIPLPATLGILGGGGLAVLLGSTMNGAGR